ncbi:hypothetical protein M413DRAFT_447749 [Hebeloma cylindrosporum]|uniref:Uncharacterized protein n=1 Tax=Hebeloma cylindrosporum TaxID=76867 RepID=A0A0C3BPB5_HEBCY|nr:hypothetical protein M413DRAFT_447749 [Hebeloma cylindrosporum h7]
MALDSGYVQVILAVCLLPLVVAGYWWRNVQISYRWIRILIWHEEGECEYLEWKGFVGATETQQRARPIHTCNTTPDSIGCSHSQHIPGEKCWRGTIDRFFNGSIQRRKIKKPSKLPVNQSFLCIDTQFIKAFVLLAVNHVNTPLEIEASRHKESGEILAHISLFPNQLHHFFQRNLTILEIDRLLRGYPPFYREVLSCNGMRVPSPIRTDRDVSRGGWVIGAGLSFTNPIPVYVDTFHKGSTVRGEVFWTALTRVKAVLENNIRLIYLDDASISQRINAVINGLTHIINEKTDSGLDHACEDSGLMSYTARILTQEECIRAMRIFNESYRLDNDGLANLKRRLQPMILEVLKAALMGAKACIAYVKDPGRELDSIIPAILVNSERVFLQGCQGDRIGTY